MAIAFIQAGSASSGAASSVTVSLPGNSSAGDLLIGNASFGTATANTVTVTDGALNTYGTAVGPTVSGIRVGAEVFAANAGATGSLIFTYSAAVTSNQYAVEYSGVATSNPLDVAGSATGSSTNGTTGTITSTNANDLFVISIVEVTANTGYIPSTGYTTRGTLTRSGIADKIVSATETSAGTWTFSTTGAWVAMITTYKAAAGGATPQVVLGYKTLMGVGR